MMQFSEMEQVSEIDHRSEDRLSEPEGSKRQDATSAVRKVSIIYSTIFISLSKNDNLYIFKEYPKNTLASSGDK